MVAETAATTGTSRATVFHIWTQANQVCHSVICFWICTLVLWFHVMPCVNNKGPDTFCTEFTYSSSCDLMPNLAAFRQVFPHSQTAGTTTEICTSVIKFSLSWCYNSLWDLAHSTVLFHTSLSTAILLQFWIYIFPRSTLSLSSHLNLGLPTLLTAIGLHSVILFNFLSLSILTICPIHHILCAVIYLTISACLISKSISS